MTATWVHAAAILLVTLPASAQSAAQQVLSIDVPGHHPAAFVEAAGGGPRPVVIALHGNFDRPEWMCASWAPIVQGRAFVLCPRGLPRDDAQGQDRWQLPLPGPLLREIAAARRALAERYPGRVDEGPDVWAGFSQGANRIARLASSNPNGYLRIQLVEGGDALWADARPYARVPGRAAIVCALRWCEMRSTRVARTLEAGRARARVELIPASHSDRETMAPAIRRTFDWLIEDDPRFAR
ncbi:MAG: hypothetical protein IT378_16645 [Sandaracinaceae bacterium]|nr:hypothetical protein [Sandaracinaceae bacterium]